MPVIYLQLDSSSSAGRLLGRFRPGLYANPSGLGDRKATHSRLGPAKVPQPGVDIINMAAPARSLASNGARWQV
jgi:hypothetical protein